VLRARTPALGPAPSATVAMPRMESTMLAEGAPPFTIADLARMRASANVRSPALPAEIMSLLRTEPDDIDLASDVAAASAGPPARTTERAFPMPSPPPWHPGAPAPPPEPAAAAAPKRRRSTLLMSGTAAVALGVVAVGAVTYQL